MSDTTTMTRRNVHLPDDLWISIQQAAAAEGAKRQKPMHASEWIRTTLQTRLKRLQR